MTIPNAGLSRQVPSLTNSLYTAEQQQPFPVCCLKTIDTRRICHTFGNRSDILTHTPHENRRGTTPGETTRLYNARKRRLVCNPTLCNADTNQPPWSLSLAEAVSSNKQQEIVSARRCNGGRTRLGHGRFPSHVGAPTGSHAVGQVSKSETCGSKNIAREWIAFKLHIVEF